MKNLEKLNNVEKARLLHQLFPQEIPAFVEFAQGMCHAIIVDEPTQREQWEIRFFSFDFWLQLVKQADGRVSHYGKTLDTSSRLFSDQLFDGYLAMYMVHCLTSYITVKEHPNDKFVMAVRLFFHP